MKVNRLHTDLILVGGGHAHVGVIRALAMKPIPGVRITLVNSASETPYSGMLPGLISGQYDWDQCHIDLLRLSRWAQIRFVRARAVGLDAQAQTLKLIDSASGLERSLYYDYLSLNPGATPNLNVPGARGRVLAVKPIAHFVDQFERQILAAQDARHHSVVVGAGVGAVEVVLAANLRVPNHQWTLIVGQQGLLPGVPQLVREHIQQVCVARGIRLVKGPVVRVEPNQLILGDQSVPFDHCLWNTTAAAPEWLRDTELPLDKLGFVQVEKDLSVKGHPNIFVAGDSAALNRPKAGVFAVRAGPVLAQNIRRRIQGKSTLPWRIQRRWLAILNLGRGQALAWRGPDEQARVFKGAWVWWLKDWIDRRFMGKFSSRLPVLKMQQPSEDPPLCLGCGGKAPAQALGAVDLARDAATLDVQGPLQVTTDSLTDPLGDPWWLGRLAAMHAAGDIQVSGGQVIAHTSSITVPDNQSNLVARDLEYTREGLASIELGQNLGGHSAAGAQANLTLTLMGDGSSCRGDLAPGQRVWISRPLGSGLLFSGAMENRVRGRFIDRWCDRAIDLSYDLDEIQAPIRMTDITGFGLAGHLSSLIDKLGVQWQGDMPAYDGIDFEAMPVLAASNASLAGNLIDGLSVRNHALAVDPQTLGGVLAIWPADYQPPKNWTHVATLIEPATPKV